MKENITIYDIAKRAKVSTTTVYKAIHNRQGVSAARKKEILKIASEMNYKSNTIAQTLARKELKIGIVFEVLNQEFTSFVMKGAENALYHLENYKVSAVLSETGNDINKERVLQNFQNLLDEKVDGIILFASVPYAEYSLFNAVLTERNIPLVIVNNEVPSLKYLTCVQYDGNQLGQIAGDLMNLCNRGGSSVVFIGNKDVLVQNQTVLGFKQAIERSGGVLINAYENQFDEQVNVMCIENMLRNYPYVSGIFVGVSQSIGVIETLKQKNLLDKYKIITVDTFPAIREYLSRGEVVATLDRHPFIMGQIAVRTVYSYLVHPFQMEERILVPPGVVLPSSSHISNSNQNFMELPIMIPEICFKN